MAAFHMRVRTDCSLCGQRGSGSWPWSEQDRGTHGGSLRLWSRAQWGVRHTGESGQGPGGGIEPGTYQVRGQMPSPRAGAGGAEPLGG